MKNVKIKLTVWVIIILAGIIFYLQNRSPEVSLVIFGSETIALSVSLWLIIGAIAGFITSIVLQLLLGVYSRQRRRSRQWEDEADDEDQEDGDFEFPEATETTNERFASSTRFNATKEANSVPNSRQKEDLPEEEDWESPPKREDWDDLDDEWNIEEPPKREINPPPPSNENFYEVQNRPEKTSQQGSVYSYRYRQASSQSDNSERIEEEEEENDNNDDDDETNQSPKVYEANYRVIRPPLWNLPDAEEDWDEEEDDTDKR